MRFQRSFTQLANNRLQPTAAAVGLAAAAEAARWADLTGRKDAQA